MHDVTTSIETAIPQTSTHVYVLYKLNSGFASRDGSEAGTGIDTRFDVQVNGRAAPMTVHLGPFYYPAGEKVKA